jgi:hypothetical protein
MVRPVRHIGSGFCLAIIALLAGGQNGAQAADRYFALVFSSQARPKLPRYTHVWATMVHVANAEQPPSQWAFQVDTISWFPASLVVHTFKLRSEPGINLDLQKTLAHVQRQGQHVSVWGPREVPQFMYCEFMTQKARLESGQVQYQAIDSFRNPQNVSDCIHSLTDMDRARSRTAYPLSRFGDDAAEQFVKVLAKRGHLLPVDAMTETVYQALGLPCQCITRRSCTSDGRFPLGR